MEAIRLHPELGSSALALGEADASQGSVHRPTPELREGVGFETQAQFASRAQGASRPAHKGRGHKAWARPGESGSSPGPPSGSPGPAGSPELAR